MGIQLAIGEFPAQEANNAPMHWFRHVETTLSMVYCIKVMVP